jgi:hypothetical protein
MYVGNALPLCLSYSSDILHELTKEIISVYSQCTQHAKLSKKCTHCTRMYAAHSPNLSFVTPHRLTRMHPQYSVLTHIGSPFRPPSVTLPLLLLLFNSDRRRHESTHVRTIRCSQWPAAIARGRGLHICRAVKPCRGTEASEAELNALPRHL